MWKCSLTVLLGEEPDAVILSEERIATDFALGLDLLWMRIKQQISLTDVGLTHHPISVQVIGWCDPISAPYNQADAMKGQVLIDRARARDEEASLSKLLHEEQTRVGYPKEQREGPQGGVQNAF